MKTLIVTLAMLLSFTSSAVATDISDLAWNESNIETLRQFSKDAIVRFISEVPGIDANVATNYILYSTFVDLADDGKYELVVTNSPGPCCTNLTIYWQDAPGKVRFESFTGGADPKKTIRDLNGDGKDELILSSYLDSDAYRGAQPTPMWPRVYRLQGGKYVEASRDFPDFYTGEALPQLEKEISKAQRLWRPGSPGEARVAVLEMEGTRFCACSDAIPPPVLNRRANGQPARIPNWWKMRSWYSATSEAMTKRRAKPSSHGRTRCNANG